MEQGDQVGVSSSSGLSTEVTQLLLSRGLRSEDFIAWLGTQRQNGSDLKNWTSEELGRKGAYYSEVYGVKAPVPPLAATTTTTTATAPEQQPAEHPNGVATESGHSRDSSHSDPGAGGEGEGRAVAEGGEGRGAAAPVPVQPVQSVRMEK